MLRGGRNERATRVTKLRSETCDNRKHSHDYWEILLHPLGFWRFKVKLKVLKLSVCNHEDIEGEWRHSSTYSQPLPQCWSGRFLQTEHFLLLRDSNSGPPIPWLVRFAGKLMMRYRVNGHRRFDGPHCLHLQDRQSTAGPKYTHSPASQNTWIFRLFVTAMERLRSRQTAVNIVALDRPTAGVRASDAA